MFCAQRPNQLWAVDFTYLPKSSGMAFTAFVADVVSRRIVGWRATNRMPTELTLDALEIALWVRPRVGESVEGVIHRYDAGPQCVALRCTDRIAELGALTSIETVSDSYTSALADSVIGLYKNECVKIDGLFRTRDELELATLSWVNRFNENRRHHSNGYLTPVEKEDLHCRENRTREQPLL